MSTFIGLPSQGTILFIRGYQDSTGTFGPERMSGFPPCPYRRSFMALAPCIQRALWEAGFSRIQSDGELLTEMWTEHEDFRNSLISSVALKGSYSSEEAEQIIQLLIDKVSPGTPVSGYSTIQREWALRDRALDREYQIKVCEEIVIKKWRHWKPSRVSQPSAVTMRDIELALREKWMERMIAHVLPVGDHFTHIQPLLACQDLATEIKHLFGTTRFRTIRVHCLNLEHILKHGISLPWTEDALRQLLNVAKDAEMTTSRLSQMWRTVAWLAKRFGALMPDSLDRLVRKKESIMDTLVSTAVAPQKKAAVPSLSVIIALEQGLHNTALPLAIRFILGIARFMAGSSARFNDIQHCRPKDFYVTSNSMEVLAWQTKTTGLSGSRRKPCPLIAPQWSFTGLKWWATLMSILEKMSGHPALQSMDFAIPTVGRELKGFIARPCSYSRALRWLKEALYHVCRREDVLPLTWHSMRVFMPDCAFQAQIPPEQRQYLGNWAAASTADVYTRDKRNVVCQIWEQVCGRMSTIQVDGRRMAREDLKHPDYLLQQELEPSQDFTTPKKAMASEASSPGSWQVVSVSATPSPPTGTFGPEQGKAGKEHDQLQADMVPEPRGPLTVVCRVVGKSSNSKCVVHLFDTEGKGIGCGWKPNSDKFKFLTSEDIGAEPDLYSQCIKCFKYHTWPSTWQTSHSKPEEDSGFNGSSSSDSSCGSLTDDSVDTDSDKEQITLE